MVCAVVVDKNDDFGPRAVAADKVDGGGTSRDETVNG